MSYHGGYDNESLGGPRHTVQDREERDPLFSSLLDREPARPAQYRRSGPGKVTSKPLRRKPDILPAWGTGAGRAFCGHTDLWWAAGMVLGAVLLLAGALIVLGNGAASIWGSWALLGFLRVPVPALGVLPALPWWIVPAVIFFIQVVARHIDELRWLWRPSVVFDGTTTALYFVSTLPGVVDLTQFSGASIASVVSAGLGLGVAVGAERLLLGAIGMLLALWRGR